MSVLFTEALESRTLMSASAATIALSQAVQLDHLQIRQDLLTFKSDVLNCFITMKGDLSLLKGDNLKAATTVTPLVAKFRADMKAMRSELLSDRLTQRANALADESVIVGDLKKIVQDRGNDTAEAADHAQLLTDRIKLQTDMIAGLNTRLTTRQNDYTTLFNDMSAILTAAQSDPNAGPKLVTDLQKWSADKTTCLNTMTTDISKLIADRTQLVSDLTAMQTA
jgi:hypothetical protein